MSATSARITVSDAKDTMIELGKLAENMLDSAGPIIINGLNDISAVYSGQDPVTGPYPDDELWSSLDACWNALSDKMLSCLEQLALAMGVSAIPTTFEWWDGIRDYMETNGTYVDPRNWSRGSDVSAALTYRRLLKDWYGNDIDTGNIDTTVIEYLGEGSGRVTSEPANLEPWIEGGAALDQSFPCWGPYFLSQNNGLVRDPAFATPRGTTSTITAQGQWTFNSLSEWGITTSNVWQDTYRSGKGLTPTQGITTDTASAYVEQLNCKPTVVPALPICICYIAGGGGTAEVTLNWGNNSQAFGSLTADSYHLLVPDRNEELWPQVFEQSNSVPRRLRATLSSIGGGATLTISVLNWIPFVLANGVWHVAYSGLTPPAIGATASIADTLGSPASSLNDMLPRLFPADPEAYLRNQSNTGDTEWGPI